MNKNACYLCGNNTGPFLNKNNYVIFKCKKCGLLQTNLNTEYSKFVQQYYGKGYFTGESEYCAYDAYERDKTYIVLNLKKMIKQLTNFQRPGKLLDVGCAMGHLLDYVSNLGWDAYGFDPSNYALSRVPEYLKPKTKNGTIDTVTYPPNTFDVVTMLDVLEHLQDPISNLKKIRSYLKDDGYLVIATGDVKSRAALIFNKKWTFYNPPQHLFFFSKSTITAILKKTGFTPIKWSTLGKWVSLGYTLHLGRSVGGSLIAKILYPIVGKLKLGKIPLYIPMNDNMVVIARKKLQ